jgi:hypothetical protein
MALTVSAAGLLSTGVIRNYNEFYDFRKLTVQTCQKLFRNRYLSFRDSSSQPRRRRHSYQQPPKTGRLHFNRPPREGPMRHPLSAPINSECGHGIGIKKRP